MNLNEEAKKRTDSHKGASSQTILIKDHDKIGLAGEIAFAKYMGIEYKPEQKPEGDGGIDFKVAFYAADGSAKNFTIDVKCSPTAGYLLVEKDKARADIFVNALYDEVTATATCLGWEWKQNVLKAETKEFKKESYAIPTRYLRPMSILKMNMVA